MHHATSAWTEEMNDFNLLLAIATELASFIVQHGSKMRTCTKLQMPYLNNSSVMPFHIFDAFLHFDREIHSQGALS